MPNMRVDVIYNLTSTDFELEFNLGACCQMRLFNTVTNNKKEYIDALAKAVTRSKIIIACGSIYGDEGLIRITAKATHKKTVVIDNSEYGIAQDMNVEIIDGSVPLVSTSGIFGGIIIESGPQTIILLSENRDVRKDIMQNLVHQYIKEVSILEIRRNSGSSVLTKPAESSNEEDTDETQPKDMENSAGEGEYIDFSKEEVTKNDLDFEAEAPSDEALKAVAEELNDLSSSIGETLYANDNTNENEEAPIENDSRDIADEIELEIEPENDTAAPEKPAEDKADSKIKLDFEEKTSPEDKKDGFSFEPQIDFTIDEENTESDTNADDNKEDNAENSINLNDYLKDTSDMSFIGDEKYEEDTEDTKTNKSLNKAIIIIAVLLIVMLLLLGYFLVYTPLKDGINPTDYIASLFSAKFKLKLFGRF